MDMTFPIVFKSAEIITEGISAWESSLLMSFISIILLAAALSTIFLAFFIQATPASSSFRI